MAYVTPKTDWRVNISGGVYIGDFLNATDYARICDNITFLAQLISTSYGVTITLDTMPSRSVNSIPYAADFNAIESNIQKLCNALIIPDAWTGQKTWYANRAAPMVEDWNRWEATILALKNRVDYDANWVDFYTSDSELFLTSDGETFKVLEG